MKPTQTLHDRGESLWLDNITRDMLNDGTLKRYRDEFSITGLTSNPTIFEEVTGHGSAYDDQIQTLSAQGLKSEQLFAELAITDLQRAADLFRPIVSGTEYYQHYAGKNVVGVCQDRRAKRWTIIERDRP